MRITCPKCRFSQNIREDKIPERAQLATCPKCGERFRFRTLEPLAEEKAQAHDSPPEASPAPQPDTQTGTQTGPDDAATSAEALRGLHEEELDRLADTPGKGEDTGGFGGLLDEDEEPDDAARQGASAPPKDIWQALDAMAPGGGAQDEDGEAAAPKVEVPFERLDEYGFFPGFFLTLKRAMFSPRLFFEVMPMNGLWRPMAFLLLISILMIASNFLWAIAGFTAGNEDLMASGGLSLPVMALVTIVVAPPFLALAYLLSAGFTHLLLLPFQAAGAGYEGTFRAMAYSSAPSTFLLLPPVTETFSVALLAVIGLWQFVLCIIGLKHIHNTSYLRIALAYACFFALLFLLILGASYLGAGGRTV